MKTRSKIDVQVDRNFECPDDRNRRTSVRIARLIASASIVVLMWPDLATAQEVTARQTDTTGYRWFGCEVGLAVGGLGLALTLPHVGKLESHSENAPDGSGASVFAAMGLVGLALGLCPAGLFSAGAIAESVEAPRDFGYGLAGAGLSGLGGAMLGYGLGQAFDGSQQNKMLTASIVGTAFGIGGYLMASLTGVDGEVHSDAQFGMLIAFASLFVLTGIVTNITIAATREDGAPPHPSALIAPAVAGLGGFFTVALLSR